MFDAILDENQLTDACEHIADYLESYWRATHPPEMEPANAMVAQLAENTLPTKPTAIPVHETQTRLRKKSFQNELHLDFTILEYIKSTHMDGVTALSHKYAVSFFQTLISSHLTSMLIGSLCRVRNAKTLQMR